MMSRNKSPQQWKAEADAARSREDYDRAIHCYTRAIEKDSGSANPPVYHSDRCEVFLTVNKHTEALLDAKLCVDRAASWGRGYDLLGKAHRGLGKAGRAKKAYRAGLRKCPPSDFALLRRGLRDLRDQEDTLRRLHGNRDEVGARFCDLYRIRKIAFKHILSDDCLKEMMDTIQHFFATKILEESLIPPDNIRNHFSDPFALENIATSVRIVCALGHRDDAENIIKNVWAHHVDGRVSGCVGVSTSMTIHEREQLEAFTCLCFSPDHLEDTTQFFYGMFRMGALRSFSDANETGQTFHIFNQKLEWLRICTSLDDILCIEKCDPTFESEYIDETRARASDHTQPPEVQGILRFLDSLVDHVDCGDDTIDVLFQFFFGLILGAFSNELQDYDQEEDQGQLPPTPPDTANVYLDRPMRRCAAYNCNATGQGYHACSRCRQAFYCSKDCQRRDWKRGGHKNRCIAEKVER